MVPRGRPGSAKESNSNTHTKKANLQLIPTRSQKEDAIRRACDTNLTYPRFPKERTYRQVLEQVKHPPHDGVETLHL